MMTSFLRIAVVMGFVRRALGTADVIVAERTHADALLGECERIWRRSRQIVARHAPRGSARSDAAV